MKYVADVLTGVRAVIALLVVLMGFNGLWATTAALFAAGILTDALDGPIARRWPYTAEENQKFFWRRRDPHMWDNAADGALTFGGLIVVTFGLLPFWQAVLVASAVPIVAVVFIGSLELAARAQKPKLAERIDVVHGWVFGAELLAMLVVMTAQATQYWVLITCLYGAATTIIVILKWDRVTSREEVNYARP